jgi:lipopolysaccharide transport system permease protein
MLGLDREDLRLLKNLVRHSFRERYLGSALGMVWGVLEPLFLLGMYTFVFGFVFRSKLPGATTSLSYVTWMISGMVPYLAVAESLANSAGAIIKGANLVKNLVFKAELLAIAATLTAILPLAVGTIFLGIVLTLDGNIPTIHILGLIPVTAGMFLGLSGIGLFLAATTVFLRDIKQSLPTLTMLLLFFTPVFYPQELMPRVIRSVTFLNPLFHVTSSFRAALLHHTWPALGSIGFLLGVGFLTFAAGLTYFRRLKPFFDSML